MACEAKIEYFQMLVVILLCRQRINLETKKILDLKKSLFSLMK